MGNHDGQLLWMACVCLLFGRSLRFGKQHSGHYRKLLAQRGSLQTPVLCKLSNQQQQQQQQVYRIPRSREVGQSYSSSVLTTLRSFFFALWLVGIQVQPDLVLVNGPGTCLPIAVSAFFFRIIGWKTGTKIVFVESFCRVNSLSLTGKLLYPIADLFAVCWEQLQEKYPRTYLVTSFIPKSKSS
mmetsp:Transcript_19466/g.48496  ORF Transcript_19466/g.48496 Transcript_19466/m.48496 type:complete len:184 (+) Transcript_19466:214-765(+)